MKFGSDIDTYGFDYNIYFINYVKNSYCMAFLMSFSNGFFLQPGTPSRLRSSLKKSVYGSRQTAVGSSSPGGEYQHVK